MPEKYVEFPDGTMQAGGETHKEAWPHTLDILLKSEDEALT